MSSVAEISNETRALLRDFPQYFEVEEGPLNVLTIRLPHPMISPASVEVWVATPPDPDAPQVLNATPTTDYSLDERNGLLKLTDETNVGKHVLVNGYYYSWCSDADIARQVEMTASEHFYNRDLTYDSLSAVEAHVIAIGAVARTLWSLCLEFSLDIDVSTPEGMFIPAHQRYSQALQMMQYWEGEYNTKAASLNVGLGALEIFRLRRVSLTTGRYVPVYKEREIDNPFRPVRLYPDIPYTAPTQPGGEKQDIIDVTEKMMPADRLRWSGVYPSASYPEALGTGSWTIREN